MGNLIDELRSVIDEKNIAVSDAAKLIGVSRATCYSWLSGREPLRSHRRLIQNAIRRMKEIGGTTD